MTTTSSKSSLAEQIRQLNDARKHVLLDVNVYPSIVPGILPIIGPSSVPQLRRWGADFLAEAFATPTLPAREKEALCVLVLQTLKGMLERPNEDPYVLRSAIQTAASIYPLVLRWIVNNSYDTQTWDCMAAIKSRVLSLWNGESQGVKICCIKFAQRVVLAQTVAIITETRRDVLDLSLSAIPLNHQVLDPRNLEAEATGLLDRMLAVLQDNSSDALIVDATLNCLSILVRTRPGTANRILNTVMNFNPLKLANSPMTPKSRVLAKSMEKTTRMLLIHLVKRDPQNPLNSRITQCIERLNRSRTEIFDEASRKRALAEQHAAAFGDAKRQRLTTGPVATDQVGIVPMPPGPTTLAAIFTLTSNPGLHSFDVSAVPAELAARICVSTLARTDAQLLDRVINGVRDRFTALEAAAVHPATVNPDTAHLGVDEDEDDYEPDFYAAEDTEQILNKLDGPSRGEQPPKADATGITLGVYRLPPPPPLTPDDTMTAAQVVIANVFSLTHRLENAGVKRSRAGANRLAATACDREAWITVLTRLATRAAALPLPVLHGISAKLEDDPSLVNTTQTSIGEKLRETLYSYVLEDFRRRIDVAITWLSEEWYSDQLQKRDLGFDALVHYDKVAIRIVEGFTPYLHAQDKVLTRFLGEIPEVNTTILDRVKSICRDPSLASLALTSLVYLVMMRPPAKEMALDAIQGIWTEYEEARPLAAKFLSRWRKAFLETNDSSGSTGQTLPHAPVSILAT